MAGRRLERRIVVKVTWKYAKRSDEGDGELRNFSTWEGKCIDCGRPVERFSTKCECGLRYSLWKPDKVEISGLNVYQMYILNGCRAGFLVHRDGWSDRVTEKQIVSVDGKVCGELEGKDFNYNNAAVEVEWEGVKKWLPKPGGKSYGLLLDREIPEHEMALRSLIRNELNKEERWRLLERLETEIGEMRTEEKSELAPIFRQLAGQIKM